MAAWVKAKYANELAVLSAWLAALLPWTVTYSGQGRGPLGSTLILVRTGVLEVQFVQALPREVVVDGQAQRLENLREVLAAVGISGLRLSEGVWASTPIASALAQSGNPEAGVRNAALVGGAGGALILAAVGISLLLYAREQWVESLFDPVRLIGTLLGGATAAFAVAAVYRWQSSIPGVPIPVGLVVIGVLAAMLLTVDRSVTGGTEPELDSERA
jgi:hypothetical protein